MARKFPDRMSLYVTAEDRANMERLMNALLALGHNFRDARGNPSYSAMMRWLIMNTLLELGYEKIDK